MTDDIITTNDTAIENFLLEADVHALMDHITNLEEHIKRVTPNDILYSVGGEINIRTRWGAVLFHAQSLRATIKAFV